MVAHHRARIAAIGRLGTAFLKRRLGALGALGISALLTASCSAAPTSPFSSPDPADPRAPAAKASYRSGLGNYTPQRPVTPGPWREQNEGVAPSPKQ